MLVYLDETLDDAMARGNMPSYAVPRKEGNPNGSKKLLDPKDKLAYFKDNVQVRCQTRRHALYSRAVRAHSRTDDGARHAQVIFFVGCRIRMSLRISTRTCITIRDQRYAKLEMRAVSRWYSCN